MYLFVLGSDYALLDFVDKISEKFQMTWSLSLFNLRIAGVAQSV
jgi:hypothetical protein